MTVSHAIVGEGAGQVVVCRLGEGSAVVADPGRFLWKTVNVAVETQVTRTRPWAGARHQPALAGVGPSGSGIPGSLLRKAMSTASEVGKRLTSETLTLQWFRSTGGTGVVALSGGVPGQVRAVELSADGPGWLIQRDALLCADAGLRLDVVASGRSGRRAGDGFDLWHCAGEGTVILQGGGAIHELEPDRYGGKVQVGTGALVGFPASMGHSFDRVGRLAAQAGPGALARHDGISLVTLEGHGPVLVRSAPAEGLAAMAAVAVVQALSPAEET